jgi:3-deoxy-D-manno-octulosonate 8-phosphate phosphatase (KDO 8-P phosphatase)
MPKKLTKSQLLARARKIKLLVMDVDGVWTDGRIYYVPNPRGGLTETKTFHSRDGLGIRIAREAGLLTGIISGRKSPIVEYRARELGIHFVFEGAMEKLRPYQKILRAAGVTDAQVCYVGDDVVDLPILTRAGLAVGVGNGSPVIRPYVHYWTKAPGGSGAVRETIELILTAQGKWKRILADFIGEKPRSLAAG